MFEAVSRACRGEIDCGFVGMTIDDKPPRFLPRVKTYLGPQVSRTEVGYEWRNISVVHIFDLADRDCPQHIVRVDGAPLELIRYFDAGVWTAEIWEAVDDRLSAVPSSNIPNEHGR